MELSNLEIGGGFVRSTAVGWHLELPAGDRYADAQLDDTAEKPRGQFAWKPPLRMTIRARTSVPAPRGTFGFGFWNDPFTISLGLGGAVRHLPTMPQTAWFFYLSPPGDLPLDPRASGSGWKASTMRSQRLPGWMLAPLAAISAALLSFPLTRQPTFSLARRFFQAEETVLVADPSQWHEYRIEWHTDAVSFCVDNQPTLISNRPPIPPLGLVLWIDNQYAILSPERGIGFGVLPLAEAQYLELEDLRIESLAGA
jgi:hypothetical protein